MARKRNGPVLAGEASGSLDGPVKIPQPSPQARHHFTQANQVNQLVSVSEADPDLGFMARMMALCSLPRTNPGNRHQYKRVNGLFALYMQGRPGDQTTLWQYSPIVTRLGVHRSSEDRKP